MEPIQIIVRFGDIDGVSDRTARNLLRDLAKVCRRTQMREVEALMRFAHLNRRERQSLRDKISNDIETGPVYYLKTVETGSIEIVIALSAFGLWLLQATAGETLKSAWKETRLHNAIISWMQTRRAEKVSEIIKDETRSLEFLSGRAIASASSQDRVIKITLQPSEYAEIHESEPIDDDRILEMAEKILALRRPER